MQLFINVRCLLRAQEKTAAQEEATAAKSEIEEVKQQLTELQAAPSSDGTEDAVARLIQLIYFAMVTILPAAGLGRILESKPIFMHLNSAMSYCCGSDRCTCFFVSWTVTFNLPRVVMISLG